MQFTQNNLVMAILILSTIFVLFGLFFFYQAMLAIMKIKSMVDCTLDFMLRTERISKHEGTDTD